MEGPARSISLSLAIMAAVISFLPFGCDGSDEPEVWIERIGDGPHVDISDGNTTAKLEGGLMIIWPEGIDRIEVFLESGSFDERTTIMDHVEFRYPADNISFDVSILVLEGTSAGTHSLPVSGSYFFRDEWGNDITRSIQPVWFRYHVDPCMALSIGPWHEDDDNVGANRGSWTDIWAFVHNDGNDDVNCRLRAVNEFHLAIQGISVHRPEQSWNLEEWIGAGEMAHLKLQFNVSRSTQPGRHIVLLGVEYKDGDGVWLPFDLDPLETYIDVASDRDDSTWLLSPGPGVPVLALSMAVLAVVLAIGRRSTVRKFRLPRSVLNDDGK